MARLSEEGKLRLIAHHDCFLFDLDGTLWRGGVPIPGVAAVLALLRSLGKTVLFVTNNSTLSRVAFAAKLVAAGLPAVVRPLLLLRWRARGRGRCDRRFARPPAAAAATARPARPPSPRAFRLPRTGEGRLLLRLRRRRVRAVAPRL
jgi:hypothetical protein